MPTPPDPAFRRFGLAVCAAALAASCLPYVLAWLGTPPDRQFAWGVGYLPDTLGNLVFTRQAADGRWLFANAYTGEPHPPRFLHPMFLLVGWTQRLTGWPPGFVFQLWRIACAAALLHALVRAAERWLPAGAGRRAALALAVTGGGTGFLAPVLPWFSRAADIRGAEITTWFSLYQQAHFAAALAAIVWMMLHLTRAVETGSWRAGLSAGLCHLLLDTIHPYDAPVPIAVGLAYAGWTWMRNSRGGSPAAGQAPAFPFLPLSLFFLLPLPFLVYNAWLTLFVPVYTDFAREGLVALPWPALDYALGYALLLPLAGRGAISALRARDPGWRAIVAWLLVVPVLMALPIPARRKLMEGYHLMLCLAAARGWAAWVERASPPAGLRIAVTAAGLVVLSASQVYVAARDLYAIALSRDPARPGIRLDAGRMQFPLDRPADRFFFGSDWIGGILMRRVDRYDLDPALLRVLADSATALPRESVLLAAPETGLLAPMFAPHRVVAGHVFGTLRRAEKEATIAAIMDGDLPDDARRMLVERTGAGAILEDDALRALGRWRPATAAWCRELAAAGGVRLWAVGPPPALPPAAAARARALADAFEYAHLGRALYDQGWMAHAAEWLRRAVLLAPDRPRFRAWLEVAARSGPPPPP